MPTLMKLPRLDAHSCELFVVFFLAHVSNFNYSHFVFIFVYLPFHLFLGWWWWFLERGIIIPHVPLTILLSGYGFRWQPNACVYVFMWKTIIHVWSFCRLFNLITFLWFCHVIWFIRRDFKGFISFDVCTKPTYFHLKLNSQMSGSKTWPFASGLTNFRSYHKVHCCIYLMKREREKNDFF